MSNLADPKTGVSRRRFLQMIGATAGGAALAGGVVRPATAASPVTSESAPAILIDLSRCVGCGNCQRACCEANDLNPTPEQMGQLSTQTFTALDRFDLADGKTRFVKRQCMQCLNPACASACPSTAMYKADLGPIAWRGERCLGCRYCMVSCPFGIIRFEWQDGLAPQIRKCMFCLHRQEVGEEPACAGACPSGALKFGGRGNLLRQAHARIAARPSFYVNHVFGEYEAGGTGMLYISDVPFEQLGFRTSVTKTAIPEYTWNIMEKIPPVIGTMAIALTGITLYNQRRTGGHHEEPEWLREEK